MAAMIGNTQIGSSRQITVTKRKSSLFRARLAGHGSIGSGAVRPELPVNSARSNKIEFRLKGGLTVRVEEFYAGLTLLGFLAGSEQAVRKEIIREISERARAQLPKTYGLLIKPLPAREVPRYTFLVCLGSDRPVSNNDADSSGLVVCWTGNSLDLSLRELIEREICGIDWDLHAQDVWT